MSMNTPTESGKGGTLLSIDQNLKYKVRGNLDIYSKYTLKYLSLSVQSS